MYDSCMAYVCVCVYMCVCAPYDPHRKKDKGGINFVNTAKDPKLDLEAVKAVCQEYRYVCVSVCVCVCVCRPCAFALVQARARSRMCVFRVRCRLHEGL